MEKTNVAETLSYDLADVLNGNLLENVIKALQHLQNLYAKDYPSLKIHILHDEDTDDDITLVGIREETDEEYERRIRQEANMKAAQKRSVAQYKAHIKKEAIRLGIVK